MDCGRTESSLDNVVTRPLMTVTKSTTTTMMTMTNFLEMECLSVSPTESEMPDGNWKARVTAVATVVSAPSEGSAADYDEQVETTRQECSEVTGRRRPPAAMVTTMCHASDCCATKCCVPAEVNLR